MTPWEVFLSVFEPTTIVADTLLGVAFGVFFWHTMTRVVWWRVAIVWLPALTFMVATSAGRYVDGSTLWPAWLAAAVLWSWSVLVAITTSLAWRRIRRGRA